MWPRTTPPTTTTPPRASPLNPCCLYRSRFSARWDGLADYLHKRGETTETGAFGRSGAFPLASRRRVQKKLGLFEGNCLLAGTFPSSASAGQKKKKKYAVAFLAARIARSGHPGFFVLEKGNRFVPPSRRSGGQHTWTSCHAMDACTGAYAMDNPGSPGLGGPDTRYYGVALVEPVIRCTTYTSDRGYRPLC